MAPMKTQCHGVDYITFHTARMPKHSAHRIKHGAFTATVFFPTIISRLRQPASIAASMGGRRPRMASGRHGTARGFSVSGGASG